MAAKKSLPTFVFLLIMPLMLCFTPQAQAQSGDNAPPELIMKTFKGPSSRPQAAPKSAEELALISPPHQSKLTPGMVTFQWNPPPKYRNKEVELTVVKVDNGRMFRKKVKGATSWKVSCTPGHYRWQVAKKPGRYAENGWAHFHVVDMKRSLASTPQFKKTQIIPDQDQVDAGY